MRMFLNYLCYSHFYENVLFLFLFLSVFSVFSLYTFLFYSMLSLISDPRRGCYMGLNAFIFFFFFFRHFCPGHISGTVTRRDSKLSVLLGSAV